MRLSFDHRTVCQRRLSGLGVPLALAACLMSLPLPSPATTAAERDPAATVRVTTYNIRYQNPNDGLDQWVHRASAVAEVIRDSDIVGLQEATRRQIDDLRATLNGFQWYGVGRDDAQDAGEFCPIFWRRDRFEAIDRGTFWLAPDPQAIGQPAWGARIPRICSWVVLRRSAEPGDAADPAESGGGAELLVMNTHFDHQSEAARVNAARLLRQQAQRLAGDRDLIVMGDLNARPDSEALSILTSPDPDGLALADTIGRSETAPQGPTGTWNGFKQIDPQTRIDFILTRPERPRVIAHHTADPKTASGRFASDHLPVSVSIALGD